MCCFHPISPSSSALSYSIDRARLSCLQFQWHSYEAVPYIRGASQITIFQFPGRVPGSCLAQIPFGDLINRTLLRHAYYAVFRLDMLIFYDIYPRLAVCFFSATSCFSLVLSMTVGHGARGNERKNCYELTNEVNWNRPFVREIRTHCRFERQIRAVE